MSAQQWFWIGCGAAALLIAVAAGIAEGRRQRRDDLDRTGWVPWRGIQVAAVFAMLGVLMLAIKSG
jgi:uncharacterized membrane protein